MRDIELELVSVGEILSGKSLLIPAYQRRYSWKDNQRETLIRDIYQHLIADKKLIDRYFCGSIILEKLDDDRYGVADGQQRVTTIIILLKALLTFDDVASSEFADNISSTIYRAKNGFLSFADNKQDREFKRCLSLNNTAELKSNFDIAYKQMLSIFREFPDGHRVAFASQIIQSTTFALTIAPMHSGLMLFERANNRGLSLSLTDKVKSIVLNTASDVIGVSRGWESFLTYCQSTDRSSCHHLLNYLWIRSSDGERITAGLAIDAFQKHIRNSSDELVLDLENYAEYASNLELCLNPNIRLTCRNFRHLHCLKKQHQIRAVMTAARTMSEKDQRLFLGDLEKTAMVIALTSPLPADVTQILGKVIVSLQLTQQYSDVSSILRRYRNSLAYEFDDCVRHKIIVSAMNNVRALLYYLEAYLQQESGSSVLAADDMGGTIEHILPQSKRIESRTVDLIGNLTLLDQTINSHIGDANFADKTDAYQHQKFLLTQSLVRDFQVASRNEILRPILYRAGGTWQESDIIARGKMLSELSAKVFDFDYQAAADRVDLYQSKIEIPQANNLKSVYHTLISIAAGNSTLQEIYEFHKAMLDKDITDRETGYTITALEILELVDKEKSELGSTVMLSPTGLLATQLEYADFVKAYVAPNPVLISLSQMSREDCIAFIAVNAGLQGSTLARRYSCLRTWFIECGLIDS
jgi:hypothetical protein